MVLKSSRHFNIHQLMNECCRLSEIIFCLKSPRQHIAVPVIDVLYIIEGLSANADLITGGYFFFK